MGLRMWKDPDEEACVEDTAAKLDRAAAARRSTIRREPSVRPGRDNVPPQSISVFLRNRHQTMLRTRDRLRQEERDTDSQIAQLQNELERLRRIRIRNRARLNTELEITRAGRDLIQSSSSADRQISDENAEANADTSTDATRPPLPRPPRESNLRFEFNPSGTSRSSSPWRYQVLSRNAMPGPLMPSPPHSAGNDRRDQSIPDGPIPDESWSTDHTSMPALTEGFAPARGASQNVLNQHSSSRLEDDFQGLETPPPEDWESSYPRLYRVGHISPRPLPRVDGLGDRGRSLSPLSDPNEEDTWMTNLLTTMDTSQPSSATSFTSTRSDSIRRSQHSSQTTSTSFGEIGAVDDSCDLDLPEGITEDDAREIRERYRPRRSRDRMTGLRGMQEHLDRVGSSEYGMFHAILERMRNQETVPDDWWATVGLPPDFGRNP